MQTNKTRVILLGEPSAEEVSRFLAGRLGIQASIENAGDCRFMSLAPNESLVRNMYCLGGKSVIQEYGMVHRGGISVLQFAAGPNSPRLAETLASEFGGYVLADDNGAGLAFKASNQPWQRIIGRCEAAARLGVEDVLAAARRHGDGKEVEGLQAALRVAFKVLGPKGRSEFLRHPDVLGNLELGGGALTPAPITADTDTTTPGPRP